MKILTTTLCVAMLSVMPAYSVTYMKCGLNPTDGSTVQNLNSIDISFNEMVNAPINERTSIYLTRVSDDTKYPCTGAELDYTWTNYMRQCTLSFGNITSEGEYVLNIEEGCFKSWSSSTLVNPAIEAHYIVSSDAEVTNEYSVYTFSPQPGKTLPKLDRIMLTLSKAPDTTVCNESLIKDVTFVSDTHSYSCVDVSGYGNYWVLKFGESADAEPITITEAGTYTLTLPEGLFNNDVDVTENYENYVESGKITAEFIIADDIELSWTPYPAEGSKQIMGTNAKTMGVTFSFADADNITTAAVKDGAKITLMINGKEQKCLDTISTETPGYTVEGSQYGSLIFTISRELLSDESNLVSIQCDKGAFGCDGFASPAIEYTCYFDQPKTYTATLIPTDRSTVSELPQVVIEFENAETIVKPYWSSPSNATLTNLETQEETQAVSLEILDADPAVMAAAVFDAKLADGHYRFMLRAASFQLDGVDSPVVIGSYTLDASSGILTISADSSDYEYYTLDGRKLAVEHTGDLSAGIYLKRDIKTGKVAKLYQK